MYWTGVAELRCKLRDGCVCTQAEHVVYAEVRSLFSRRVALSHANQLGIGRRRNTITVYRDDVTRRRHDVTATTSSSSSSSSSMSLNMPAQTTDPASYSGDCLRLNG